MEKIWLWPEGDVPYRWEKDCVPSLDPHPVEGAKSAMVVCPGGGYVHKNPNTSGAIARMLNEIGISSYILDYRVTPCHYEAPLADAKRAIRTLRSMGYEKVGIMGTSAGGHLSCTAATQYDLGDPDAEDPIERMSSRPDVFVPCYPVVSFTRHRHQGSVESLLGDQKDNYALLRRFSAELNVTEDTPPAFIWHTAADELVPAVNSIMLAEALSLAGVKFELHIFPEGRHGLGTAQGDERAKEWPGMCKAWLRAQGYGCAE